MLYLPVWIFVSDNIQCRVIWAFIFIFCRGWMLLLTFFYIYMYMYICLGKLGVCTVLLGSNTLLICMFPVCLDCMYVRVICSIWSVKIFYTCLYWNVYFVYYIIWPLGRHTCVPPDGKIWYHACVLYRYFAICPIWLDSFVNMHVFVE